MDDSPIRFATGEVARYFAGIWGEKFPPILDIAQAAELLRIPVGTLRDWRSRGLLDGCCRRCGRRVLFLRDRLVQKAFELHD